MAIVNFYISSERTESDENNIITDFSALVSNHTRRSTQQYIGGQRLFFLNNNPTAKKMMEKTGKCYITRPVGHK